MKSVNIHDAKTHFSQYLARVLSGRKIIIAKSSKPVAILMPYHPEAKKRKLGQLSGLLKMREDFDAPLPNSINKAFQGKA